MDTTRHVIFICLDTLDESETNEFQTLRVVFDLAWNSIVPDDSNSNASTLNEFSQLLGTDPHHEDFLQGRMPGKPPWNRRRVVPTRRYVASVTPPNLRHGLSRVGHASLFFNSVSFSLKSFFARPLPNSDVDLRLSLINHIPSLCSCQIFSSLSDLDDD